MYWGNGTYSVQLESQEGRGEDGQKDKDRTLKMLSLLLKVGFSMFNVPVNHPRTWLKYRFGKPEEGMENLHL